MDFVDTGKSAPLHMARLVFDPRQHPTSPGCYLMRDMAGTVVYVGKAKNLRRRLATHFRAPVSRRWARVLGTVADLELILVNNETEALILEHNLIKEHRPRANRVLLEPDEGYFYIALTAESLPRLVGYRKNRINKGLERGGAVAPIARSFGPYVNRRFRDALLGFVVDHFQVRTCVPLPSRICLRFHMGACGGVCEQRVSAVEYGRAVSSAVTFLSRSHTELLRRMKRQMSEYAAELRFERASWVKHHIELLEGALEPQVVERTVNHDQDVLHFAPGSVLTLHVRRGAVYGCTFRELGMLTPDEHVVNHYTRQCPAELIVSEAGDPLGLAQRLTVHVGHRVRITRPQPGNGAANRLLQLCALNHAYRADLLSRSPTGNNPASGSASLASFGRGQVCDGRR
jgi:excinuclease ABC subunit C